MKNNKKKLNDETKIQKGDCRYVAQAQSHTLQDYLTPIFIPKHKQRIESSMAHACEVSDV